MGKIIIIGAGISGLAAAKELTKQGHSVILIEARNRIGGRIKTEYTQKTGFPIEMGAMYIHGTGKGSGLGADGDAVNPLVPLLAQIEKTKLMAVDSDSISIFNSQGKEFNAIQKYWYLKDYYTKSEEVYRNCVTQALVKQHDTISQEQKLRFERMEELLKKQRESSYRTLSLLSSENYGTKENQAALKAEENLRVELSQQHQLEITKPNVPINPTLEEVFDYRDDNIPKTDSEEFWIRKMVTMDITNNMGASLKNISLLNCTARSGYEGIDHAVVGGFNALTDQLCREATATGNLTVMLNSPITRIFYGKDRKPYIVTQNGQEIMADSIICTLPLGVLKSNQVEFSPALSKEKQTAIANLNLGLQNKVVLEFKKPFWDKSAHTICPGNDDVNLWLEYFNLYHFSSGKTNTLIASFYGDHARFKEMDQKKIAEMALQPLRKVYGKKYLEPVKVTITEWDKDPYSLGCWTVCGPRTTLADRENIMKTEGNCLFFAGEHTGNGLQATHGAYKTGLRAAQETSQYLKNLVENSPAAASLDRERKDNTECDEVTAANVTPRALVTAYQTGLVTEGMGRGTPVVHGGAGAGAGAGASIRSAGPGNFEVPSAAVVKDTGAGFAGL